MIKKIQNKLKRKVVAKKDSQPDIDTFNKEINKKNDKNEDLKERFTSNYEYVQK